MCSRRISFAFFLIGLASLTTVCFAQRPDHGKLVRFRIEDFGVVEVIVAVGTADDQNLSVIQQRRRMISSMAMHVARRRELSVARIEDLRGRRCTIGTPPAACE